MLTPTLPIELWHYIIYYAVAFCPHAHAVDGIGFNLWIRDLQSVPYDTMSIRDIALVCKAWYSLAIRYKYHNLYITKATTEQTLKQRIRMKKQTNGEMALHVAIGRQPLTEDAGKSWSSLIALCTNVVSISLGIEGVHSIDLNLFRKIKALNLMSGSLNLDTISTTQPFQNLTDLQCTIEQFQAFTATRFHFPALYRLSLVIHQLIPGMLHPDNLASSSVAFKIRHFSIVNMTHRLLDVVFDLLRYFPHVETFVFNPYNFSISTERGYISDKVKTILWPSTPDWLLVSKKSQFLSIPLNWLSWIHRQERVSFPSLKRILCIRSCAGSQSCSALDIALRQLPFFDKRVKLLCHPDQVVDI